MFTTSPSQLQILPTPLPPSLRVFHSLFMPIAPAPAEASDLLLDPGDSPTSLPASSLGLSNGLSIAASSIGYSLLAPETSKVPTVLGI